MDSHSWVKIPPTKQCTPGIRVDSHLESRSEQWHACSIYFWQGYKDSSMGERGDNLANRSGSTGY